MVPAGARCLSAITRPQARDGKVPPDAVPPRFPRREAWCATVTRPLSARPLAARRPLFELGWDNLPHDHRAVKIEAYHEAVAASAAIRRRRAMNRSTTSRSAVDQTFVISPCSQSAKRVRHDNSRCTIGDLGSLLSIISGAP